MAVEARHLHVFPSQLIASREMLNPIEANVNPISAQMGYSSVLPLSGTTTATETPLAAAAAYNSLIVDSVPQKNTMKSESGLTTYNVPVPRKRSRDSINYPLLSYPVSTQTHKNCGFFSFLGEDISLQIHQQQLDIDRLISQHMEKVRMELEEKRKRQARRIIEAIEIGMMKRLKAKEEEIEKMGKLNWALEERVKSLCVENQIWRDLAQTNEATANALRTNLEQVLAQVRDDRTRAAADDDNEDATVAPAGPAPHLHDAESCCGSTGGGDEEEDDANNIQTRQGTMTMEGCWRSVAGCGAVKDKDEEGTSNGGGGSNKNSARLCRNCGKEESCVLILPCRHLCLCTVCGSTVHTCPVCKSFKNASVHVNMS
ncbi:probable BOI-related E3 ubiquitin-protein ligase 2 [Neltuma alba]|uniref:probable BOI-related E3 ubiquitin-protein ligase 2 n=1 Tax=Neltuma alba TaxID=207710 RepID=UPI0010A45539|nr:probable BOI-related E3 ubiquitin-protein ligase 2 [Prosopis alba]